MPKKDKDGKLKKRKRYTWTDEMHAKFMCVIFELGLRKAKPKAVYEQMELPKAEEFSIYNVKANLQKYRSNSKRTVKLFSHQLQIAQDQALKRHHGKIMNPGLHAFPMPLGDVAFPMYECFKSPQKSGSRRRRSYDSMHEIGDDFDEYCYSDDDFDDDQTDEYGYESPRLGTSSDQNFVYMSHEDFEKAKSSGQGMWVWHGPSNPRAPPPIEPPPPVTQSSPPLKRKRSHTFDWVNDDLSAV